MVALKNLVQILPLIAIPAVAAPGYLRLPTSATDLATSAFDTAQSWIHGAISEAKVKWDQIESGVESKVHSEMVIENGIECESLLTAKEGKADGRHGLDPPPVPFASITSRRTYSLRS